MTVMLITWRLKLKILRTNGEEGEKLYSCSECPEKLFTADGLSCHYRHAHMLGSKDTEEKYSSDEVVLVPSSSLDIETVLEKEIVDGDDEKKLEGEQKTDDGAVEDKSENESANQKLKTRVSLNKKLIVNRKLKNWTLKVQNRKKRRVTVPLKLKVQTRKLNVMKKRRVSLNKNLNVNRIHRKLIKLKVQNRKLNVRKKRRMSLNKNLNVNRIHRKLIKLKVQKRKLKTRVSLTKKLNVNRKLMKLKVQKRKLKTRVSLNKNLNVKNWKLKVQTRKLNVTKKRTS